MKTEQLEELRQVLRGTLLAAEPMARHTSLQVGGPADAFAVPADLTDLETLLSVLAANGIPYLVVGGGFNLLVRDGGIRGVVISLARLQELALAGAGRIRVAAGVTTARLSKFAADHELTGLEFLSGIPGTVGGALRMNAGAHGGATLEQVAELTTIRAGVRTVRGRDELAYGYRSLELAAGEIVVEAQFQLEHGVAAEIGARIATCRAQREASQKVGFPNAGSFFKNPPGEAAWRLIDGAGLRGLSIGGAQVSEVHANFLVNRGGATATDFLQLMTRIKDEVLLKMGIALEPEVQVVGEE